MSEQCLICEYSSDITSCALCKITCCKNCIGHHYKSCNDLKIHGYHMCDVHSANQVIRYCFDCGKLLCKTCLNVHKHHTCLLLTDVYDNIRTNTITVLKDLQKQENNLSAVIQILDDNKIKLEGKVDERLCEVAKRADKNDMFQIKQTLKTYSNSVVDCLRDAKLQVKFLFEKDMFLIVFLRKWLQVKTIIDDSKKKETKLKMYMKQMLQQMDYNLQKVVQEFLMSTHDENTNVVNAKKEGQTYTHGLLHSTNMKHYHAGAREMSDNERAKQGCSKPTKTTTDKENTHDSSSHATVAKENTTCDHSSQNLLSASQDEKNNIYNTVPMSVNAEQTHNTKYPVEQQNKPSAQPETPDIKEITEMFSNVTIDATANEKTAKHKTKSDIVKDLVQKNGCIKPCEDSLCKKVLVDCARMKKEIEQLKSHIDTTSKELKTLKDDKKKMKMISKGLLEWLKNMENVRDFTGKWNICMDGGDDVKRFQKDMEEVFKMFMTSKQSLMTAKQNLEQKNQYYANWMNSQTTAGKKLMEKHKAELKGKQDQLQQQTQTITVLNGRISEMEQTIDSVIIQNHTLLEERNNFEKRYRETVKSQKEKNPEVLTLQNTLDQQRRDIEILKQTQERLSWQTSEKEKTIQNLEKEKNDLQLRLSSMAGNQLTKGNPAITDLSDPNRPMKIADQFKEIYDNEWTDVMECSQSVKLLFPGMKPSEIEERIIQHLYQIVKVCYHECVALLDSQIKTFENTICNMFQLDTREGERNLGTLPCVTEFVKFRRDLAEHFANKLNKMLIERIDLKDWRYPHKSKEVVDLLVKTSFFDKCVTQCWLMVIQEPPLHLDEELSAGTKYDKTQYKEFTSSGDKVKFVVWPALFLHKDGPLLCKGVVQAYN